jgi:acyl carrier protein phosphodiesterase
MNYLAHAFLSNNNKDLLIGNFIADHVRGNDFNAYSPEVIEGIHLHRRIDAFTDAHAHFKKSKRIFYVGFERYSGILIDIYFDYFLAKKFLYHSNITLETFSENVYKIYAAHDTILPKSSARFLEYVVKNNIYTAYGTTQGIERVLYHLSQRINHEIKLNDSIPLFLANEVELQANFDEFMVDIKNEFLTSNERY